MSATRVDIVPGELAYWEAQYEAAQRGQQQPQAGPDNPMADTSSSRIPTGVHRFSAYEPQPAAPLPPEIEYLPGGAIRAHTRPQPATEGTLIFTKPNGMPATIIDERTIVTLPPSMGGMQVDVASAIAAGLISPSVLSVHGARGAWDTPHPQAQPLHSAPMAPSAAPPAALAIPAQADQQQEQVTQVDLAAYVPNDAPEAFLGEHEGYVQKAASGFPEHVLNGVYAKLLANDMNLDAIRWDEVDSASGLPHGDSRQRAEYLTTMLKIRGDMVVQAVGIHESDLEAFYAWAKEDKKAELHDAMQRYILGRSANGLRKLASTYLRSGPISDAALDAAQRNGHLRYRKDSSGTVIVQLKGRPEVSLKVAQELGWI